MKLKILLIFQFFSLSFFAQTDKEIAFSKAKEAIVLMDSGDIEGSIVLLKESQKLDPENYMYPYEIAYAYTLSKDYEKAISILKPVKKNKNANDQVYQMLGNCYSYLGEPKKAIKEYEEGMKRFPNSGNLHLEKGNVYLAQKNYDEAVKNYKKAIEVEPMYAPSYYRLAKLYLYSNDKLSGLIYGEIFMNIERTSSRTQEMSELLYETYKSAIIFGENKSEIKFCDIVIDINDLKDGDLKLPLCASFGENFIKGMIGEKEFNLYSLCRIRKKFIENYFVEDYKKHSNILFEYQKKMLDDNVLDAYNFYLFRIGAPGEFQRWQKENEDLYQAFEEWYTKDENVIEITQKNKFVN